MLAIKRRFPLTPITLYASSVQGEQAAQELISAITLANQKPHCDVLLLTRGGGAIEDLWPFNDEQLAHCIFESRIPIVSAVGHEIDFTIADFVADQRAATPSAGAELLSPDQEELQQRLDHTQHRMKQAITRLLQQYQQLLHSKQTRLVHPKTFIQQQKQQLRFMAERLQQSMRRLLTDKHHQTKLQSQKLKAFPWEKIHYQYQQTLQHSEKQLKQAMKQLLTGKAQQLAHYSQQLHDMSPLNTLKRGYAVVEDPKHQEQIHSIKQIKTKQIIQVTLQDGHFTAICHSKK